MRAPRSPILRHAMEIVRNITRRKLRSFLTISGIVIGVLALTTMGSMAENFNALLDGGVERWKAEGLPVASVPQEAADRALRSGRRVLDVRRPGEWETLHLKGATLIPLAQLPARLGELEREAEWVVVCASGYRSNMAASLMQRAGFARVVNASGGMDAYLRMGLPVEVGGG